MSRLYLGVLKPKRAILGMELARVIKAVGKGVTRFRPGDAVFASTFAVNFGGHAEYKCLPKNGVIALKPAFSPRRAAAVPVQRRRPGRCRRGALNPGRGS